MPTYISLEAGELFRHRAFDFFQRRGEERCNGVTAVMVSYQHDGLHVGIVTSAVETNS